MTGSLARAIRDLPDESMVPVWWVRKLASEEEPFHGVRTPDAAELMRVDEREARRLATRFYKIQQEGHRPPVRVARTSAAPNAHWIFDAGDAAAFGEREEGAGPQLHRDEEPENPNDVQAIAARYVAGGGE